MNQVVNPFKEYEEQKQKEYNQYQEFSISIKVYYDLLKEGEIETDSFVKLVGDKVKKFEGLFN